MGSGQPLKVLLVAEATGGHLIPALQVAEELAKTGACARVWYAKRKQTAQLADSLALASHANAVEVDSLPMDGASSVMQRLWQFGRLWSEAGGYFDHFSPDVVVGFGGWVSAPILLAAHRRGLRCLVHEQNVMMGRANRWLSRWADCVAVSFTETRPQRPRTVVTGMPVRRQLGVAARHEAAAYFGLNPRRPTLLVMGGSQGSQAINQRMIEVIRLLSSQERAGWQFIHMAGSNDHPAVSEAYQKHGLSAWVGAFVSDMNSAYAASDAVFSRAGSSTIAELARCGLPAILMPFPYAGGHQLANAKLVSVCAGGVVLDEKKTTVASVLAALRRLMNDASLRAEMGSRMRSLHHADAAKRITQAILNLKRCKP